MREDLQQWIDEECVMDIGARTAAMVLYRSFAAWKTKQGHYAATVSEWGREMQNCNKVSKLKTGCMVYRGIRLREAS
jgi:hypothetical protein